jgi:hypothetical protein
MWRHWTFESKRPPLVFKRADVTPCDRYSNPERPLSLDLQRQITLLKANPDADYFFFFDDQDRPIPFILSAPDSMAEQNFYNFQEECMFGRELNGLDVIAEYLIKAMAGQPGLSAARILKQLSKEYLMDMTRLVAIEALGKQSRYRIRSGENVLGGDGQRCVDELSPSRMKH